MASVTEASSGELTESRLQPHVDVLKTALMPASLKSSSERSATVEPSTMEKERDEVQRWVLPSASWPMSSIEALTWPGMDPSEP